MEIFEPEKKVLTAGALDDVATFFQSLAKLREVLDAISDDDGSLRMELFVRRGSRTVSAEIFDESAVKELLRIEGAHAREELAHSGVQFGDWA